MLEYLLDFISLVKMSGDLSTYIRKYYPNSKLSIETDLRLRWRAIVEEAIDYFIQSDGNDKPLIAEALLIKSFSSGSYSSNSYDVTISFDGDEMIVVEDELGLGTINYVRVGNEYRRR